MILIPDPLSLANEKRSFLTLLLTTADTGAPVTFDPLYFGDVNIHCYGADVYYGDSQAVAGATQGAATPNCSVIRANATMWYEKIMVNEIFFKSLVNATPAVIAITGTLIG
jgi:hypothetical protein